MVNFIFSDIPENQKYINSKVPEDFRPQLWISIHIGKSTIWKVYTYRYSNALKWEMPSGIDFSLFESRWSFLTFCKGLNELAWREDNLFEDNVLKKMKKNYQSCKVKVLY